MRTESNYIRTYTGKKFWPLDPRPEDVDIIDIAHALSNQCRFTGHVKDFYSVAEHSVQVSFTCPEELALVGLLHDADEAYLIDLAAPVKHDPRMSFFVECGQNILNAVFEKFGLDPKQILAVKPADKTDYERERNYLMPTGKGYGMETMSPREAERNFLERFYRLSCEAPLLNDLGQKQ